MTPSVVRYVMFSDMLKEYFNVYEVEKFTKTFDYLHLSFYSEKSLRDGYSLSLFVRPLFLECGDYDFHFEFIMPPCKSKPEGFTKTFIVRVKSSDIVKFDSNYKKMLLNG